MATNRELLLNRRRAGIGDDRGFFPKTEVAPSVSRRGQGPVGQAGTGKGPGAQGIGARAAQDVLAEGTAVEGIKGVATPGFVTSLDESPTGATGLASAGGGPGQQNVSLDTVQGLQPGQSIGNFAIGKTPAGGPAKGGATGRGPVANFGLPTDRLPTFNELGGAIGGLFKFVSDLSKFNRARGLTPGVPVSKKSPTAEAGLEKARINALLKEHETAVLSGDKDRASSLQTQIDTFIKGNAGQTGGISDADIEAIRNA